MENVIQSNLHFRNAEFLTRPPEQGTKITFPPYLLLQIDVEVNQQYMSEQKKQLTFMDYLIHSDFCARFW